MHRFFLPAPVITPVAVAISVSHPAATTTAAMARALVGPVTALIS
jgi:hypothetical protein